MNTAKASTHCILTVGCVCVKWLVVYDNSEEIGLYELKFKITKPVFQTPCLSLSSAKQGFIYSFEYEINARRLCF